MIIAFCGTSGSGKTTLINEIKNAPFFKKRNADFRLEDNFVTINLLKHFMGNRLFSDYKEKKFFKKEKASLISKIFSSLVNIFYPILIYLEFLYSYFYYEKLFKRKILITDRYIYDYIVTLKDILGIKNSWISSLYMKLPKPYLLFYIKISVEISIKRNKNNIKGKITAEESFHERVIESYDEIVRRLEIIEIDNNGSLEDSVDCVRSYITLRDNLSRIRRIALIGPDGAGKTTLAKAFYNLAEKLNINCKIVHFYHENILYKLLKKIGYYGKELPSDILYAKSREYSLKQQQKQTPLFIASLRFLDSYLQYLFFVIKYKNSLIIFDRFFSDYLVSFEQLKVNYRNIFKKLIPPVDKIILLMPTPEIAYKRKPENTMDFFERSAGLYSNLAQEYDIEMIKVENKSQSEIFDEFIRLIQ